MINFLKNKEIIDFLHGEKLRVVSFSTWTEDGRVQDFDLNGCAYEENGFDYADGTLTIPVELVQDKIRRYFTYVKLSDSDIAFENPAFEKAFIKITGKTPIDLYVDWTDFLDRKSGVLQQRQDEAISTISK